MKIVCLGDSLTSGFGVFKHERWTDILIQKYKLDILNKGINGDTTTGMLSRSFNDVIKESPSHLVIMGGCNDFLANRRLENVKENVKELIKEALCYNIKPILATEIPIIKEIAMRKWSYDINYFYLQENSHLYAEWILSFSSENKLLCVDFYNLFKNKLNILDPKDLYIDGLHPTSLGHEIMAEELFSKLI